MADDETSNDDGPDEPIEVDDPTEADGDEEGDGETVEDAWTPPSKEEFEKLRATAEARKEDIRKLRAAARSAKKAAPVKKSPAAPDNGTGDQESEEVAALPDDRWKPTAARQIVAAALLEAGFDGDRKAASEFAALGRLVDIEVEDDGTANDDDVESVVEALTQKFPRMFASTESQPGEKPPPARRPTTTDKGGRDRRAPELSSSTRTSQALLRQGGYRR